MSQTSYVQIINNYIINIPISLHFVESSSPITVRLTSQAIAVIHLHTTPNQDTCSAFYVSYTYHRAAKYLHINYIDRAWLKTNGGEILGETDGDTHLPCSKVLVPTEVFKLAVKLFQIVKRIYLAN